MTHLHCISYVQGHRVKQVGVHGCCLSPFLVNGWWTRYIGRRLIEIYGIHGCKSTLCMVLMVRARSRDNVLKSQAVSEILQCLCFKAVSEIVQCFVLKRFRRLSNAFVLKWFRRLFNAFVLKRFWRLSNVFIYKTKSFFLDKGPLVEIPMVSFSLWA